MCVCVCVLCCVCVHVHVCVYSLHLPSSPSLYVMLLSHSCVYVGVHAWVCVSGCECMCVVEIVFLLPSACLNVFLCVYGRVSVCIVCVCDTSPKDPLYVVPRSHQLHPISRTAERRRGGDRGRGRGG